MAGSLTELGSAAEVDAVLICSPPDTHCSLAAEALRRGAHVIIEKPMAVATREADSLVGLARQVGRKVFVGFNRRFRPQYEKLRRRLHERPQLRGISFELRTNPSRWSAVSPPAGLLEDLASHQLDLVPWIVDRPVREIRATLQQRDGTETANIELRFSDGLLGRCLAAHGTGSAEWLEIALEDRIVIAGLGGITSARRATAGVAQRYLAVRETAGAVYRRVTGTPAFTAETFARQLGAWAAALHGDPTDACADGLAGPRCVALVDACRQSAGAGGGWVAVAGG